jgi:hypothetical protein
MFQLFLASAPTQQSELQSLKVWLLRTATEFAIRLALQLDAVTNPYALHGLAWNHTHRNRKALISYHHIAATSTD